jgi:hypothetical protein
MKPADKDKFAQAVRRGPQDHQGHRACPQAGFRGARLWPGPSANPEGVIDEFELAFPDPDKAA